MKFHGTPNKPEQQLKAGIDFVDFVDFVDYHSERIDITDQNRTQNTCMGWINGYRRKLQEGKTGKWK